MRPIAIALLVAFAAGCGGGQKTEEQSRAEVFEKAESASGAQRRPGLRAARGLVGTEHHAGGHLRPPQLPARRSSGSPSGLKVFLPHFDKFMEGDDWFKYIGKRCWAKGRLHTYTKNIEGYRGPSLELNDFSGP